MRTEALWAVGLLAATWLRPGAAQTVEPSIAIPMDNVPSCAHACLFRAVEDSPCAASDKTCICSTASIEHEATPCIRSACSFRDALAAKNATTSSCDQPIRDRSGLYNRINITLGTITAVLVALRFFFRVRFAPSPLGLDDHFLHIAFVTALPSTVMNTHGLASNGLGRDIWTIDFATLITFAKFFYVMQIMYFLHLPLLKTAMLLFFLRIFPEENCKKVLWATLIVNSIGGAAFLGGAVLQCLPVKYAWERWEEPPYEGRCLNVNAMGWAHAVFNIVLDIWMLAVPLTQIRRLRMHWKKKVGVGMMFGVGTFITVVSILRLSSLLSYANSDNPTYDQWAVANWSTIEINVGIMCACMPALRGLLVRFFPYVFGSGASRGRTDEYNAYGGSLPLSSRNLRLNTVVTSRGAGSATPTTEHVAPKTADDADTSDGARSVKGITYSRSFTIEYEQENDESSLVIMRPDGTKTKGKDSVV
ncbi:hypothetical protein F5X68DRAFT_274766 [Plectosphaerella plurivora]|uniref:CFEM domain-containing protein n=1 Tax=Plectosphaerella plurivora TaxID=936078 RepID=A0A9P9ADH0_9PEZI|nr:hypothetical protein F5X68DRAFT_274766 [Plectosphaerella plurivora]